MSNKEVDKLIDRIPKKNKYMVTTEEVVNYIFILEKRIDEAIEYIEQNELYLDYTEEYVKELHKKIERLNNIINELEKWLKKSKSMYGEEYRYNYQEVLDKLKELKENK